MDFVFVDTCTDDEEHESCSPSLPKRPRSCNPDALFYREVPASVLLNSCRHDTASLKKLQQIWCTVVEAGYTGYLESHRITLAPGASAPWKNPATKLADGRNSALMCMRHIMILLLSKIYGLYTNDQAVANEYRSHGYTVVDLADDDEWYCMYALELPKAVAYSSKLKTADRLCQNDVYYKSLFQPANQQSAMTCQDLMYLVEVVAQAIVDEHGNFVCDYPRNGEEHVQALFYGKISIDWRALAVLIFGTSSGEGQNPRVYGGHGIPDFPLVGDIWPFTWVCKPKDATVHSETVLFSTALDKGGDFVNNDGPCRFYTYRDIPTSLSANYFVGNSKTIEGVVDVAKVEDLMELGEALVTLMQTADTSTEDVLNSIRYFIEELGKLNPSIVCTLLQQYTTPLVGDDGLTKGVQPDRETIDSLSDDQLVAFWHVGASFGRLVSPTVDLTAKLFVMVGVPGSGKTELCEGVMDRLFNPIVLPDPAHVAPRFAMQPVLSNAERQLAPSVKDSMLLSQNESVQPNLYGYNLGWHGSEFYRASDMKEGGSSMPIQINRQVLGENTKKATKVVAEKKGSFLGGAGGGSDGIVCLPMHVLAARNGPHPATTTATVKMPIWSMFLASCMMTDAELEALGKGGRIDPRGSGVRRVATPMFFEVPLTNERDFLLKDAHPSVNPKLGRSVCDMTTSGTSGVALLYFLNLAFRTTAARNGIRASAAACLQFEKTRLFRASLERWSKMNSTSMRDEVMNLVELSSEAFQGTRVECTYHSQKYRIGYCLPATKFKRKLKKYSWTDVEAMLLPGRKKRNVQHCVHCGLVVHSSMADSHCRQLGAWYAEGGEFANNIDRIECLDGEQHTFKSGDVITDWAYRVVVQNSAAYASL